MSGNVKHLYDERGYVIVRKLFSPERVRELKTVCDDILEQWLGESTDPESASDSTNMAYLTEPRYFKDHPERLTLLLETIADENILRILDHILDGEPLFHNTQYFFNPATETRDGDWHRDQQFGAPDEETEKLRMSRHTGVHLHVAFLPDDNLEFVSGSHARWDTREELEIRKGLNGRRKNERGGAHAERIRLDAGDAVFFSAWGIHRGRYVVDVPRRTFDIIYGTPSRHRLWVTPPPTCFLEHGVLEGLSPRARLLFERYINTYRDNWLSGQFDF